MSRAREKSKGDLIHHKRKEVKEMKRIVLMLTVMALLMLAVAGPASAQSYSYCWYSYYC